MGPLVIAAALAFQKYQEAQQKKEARKEARGEQQASRAAELGYPTSYAAGAAANNIDQIEGPNYLGMLMDEEDKKKKDGAGSSDLEGRDYLKLLAG
jgi:hypothetical protein